MKVAVFTLRSVGVGIVAGMLVAVAFGLFAGASWGLAIVNGLSAGALVLTVSIGMNDDRVDWGSVPPGRRGTWNLAYSVILIPAVFLEYLTGFWFDSDGVPLLNGIKFGVVDLIALKALFLTTGFAAYALGNITAKLEHLVGDEGVHPYPLHVTPPDGPRRSS